MSSVNIAPDTAPDTGQNVSTRQIILDTCRDIARDTNAPPAARVQAARTLAEMAGLLGKTQAGAIDMGETRAAEMSPEDIDRELARLSGTGKRN